MDRMTFSEILAMQGGRKNKYRNKKTVIDGIEFDSRKEANRYIELKQLEAAGKIKDLKRQVKFELTPAVYEELPEVYTKGPNKGQHKKGKCIEHAAYYVADFVYNIPISSMAGKLVVEDTKGFRTKEYILKRKMMLYRHGIAIKEI